MPLPIPEKNETQDAFIDRCLGDKAIQDEFGKGSDQAAAVCLRQWSEKDKKQERQWLRASAPSAVIGVDRDKRILKGYVIAQEGSFKTHGRGAFDRQSLKDIVRLMSLKSAGLKSRFAHPSLSDDGIGKFLGRARNPRMDRTRNADGKEVAAVRADLHFDPTASKTPSGDLAGYIMSLAETDPDALSSSLVLQQEELFRQDKNGKPLVDPDGNELPPLWIPKKLHASDIVDEGDAVDGLLSAGIDVDILPDAAVRRGAELLDRAFPGASPDVIRARCLAWLDRYLELRGGITLPRVGEPYPEKPPTPRLDERRLRMDKMALAARELST